MSNSVTTLIAATDENFDEQSYLAANPGVAAYVRDGRLPDGLTHFRGTGRKEERKLIQTSAIREMRERKISRLQPYLQWPTTPERLSGGGFNCLPDDLAKLAGVEPTDAISSHGYEPKIEKMVEDHPDNLILDAGAGFRPVYYENVVNLEIVPYATTDVLAVLEKIPFKDGTFDFIISNAVLEHVRDPFSAAKEISRVLKPGGKMYILVPFLQPYHGYPHHYYNMTKTGLRNLFGESISVDSHTVPFYFHPVWAASWFMNAWARGLTPETCEKFENMTIKEIMNFRVEDMKSPFVSELSEDKQFELASGTFLIGTKV